MVRQSVFLLSLVFSTVTCVAQGLFLENLKNSTWAVEGHYNEATIRKAKEIRLTKWRLPLDSLKHATTIWTFKDDLAISHYDPLLGQEKRVATHRYQLDSDSGQLAISNNGSKPLTYRVSMVSTGSYLF